MEGAKASPDNRRRSSVPWGLLGMAMLVVGVEVFFSRHEDGFTSVSTVSSRFAERASREARRYEVLCFGDSQVKVGIVPRVVEARTGKRTFNLAILGAQAPSCSVILRRALESGARPSALLVDFNAALLSDDPHFQRVMFATQSTFQDYFELAWTVGDAGLFGALAVTRLLPTVRARDAIRNDVLTVFHSRFADPRRRLIHCRLIPAHRRNWAANGGAHLMPRNPAVANASVFHDEAISYPKKWKCQPVNRAYVTKFLQLAAAHRIPVFFLVAPQHPRVQANRERLGLDALYTRFVREVTAADPNVTVIDGRYSGFEPAAFVDSSHLDCQGAYNFSDEVAAIVSDQLRSNDPDRPRWVMLPPYRDRPVTVPLEDFGQSEVALGTSPTVLRR